MESHEPSDFEMALALAESGETQFYGVLGRMYAEGDGVPKDMKKAFEWSLKAAEQGEVAAQFMVGAFYAEGQGISRNDVKAAEWPRKAAEQGSDGAQFFLGRCYAEGTGVAKDPPKAAEWYRKAAEQGYVYAQLNLGVMLFDGAGVPKNARQGEKWLRKAAGQGNAEAQVLVAYMEKEAAARKTASVPVKASQAPAGKAPARNAGTSGKAASGGNEKCTLVTFVIPIVIALVGSGLAAWAGGKFLGRLPLVGPFMRTAGAFLGLLVGYSIGGPAKGSSTYKDYRRKKVLNTVIFIALLGAMVVPQFLLDWRNSGHRFSLKTAVERIGGVKTATVTADALNMRAAPSANGALVKTLKRGDTLTVTGEIADGWAPVEHDGAIGFVSARYIE